jgi:hypothetical protein
MVGACLNALDLGEVQRLEEIEGIVVHLEKKTRSVINSDK